MERDLDDAPPMESRAAERLFIEDALAYQESAQDALNRLKTHIQGLDSVVREEIRRTMVDEFRGVAAECQHAIRSLRSLGRAANLRLTLWSVGIVGACVILALTTIWWITPSRREMDTLRSTRDRYALSVAELERRGGRIELRRCGPADARLCVRIDGGAPAYGHDYRVIKGY